MILHFENETSDDFEYPDQLRMRVAMGLRNLFSKRKDDGEICFKWGMEGFQYII